MVKLTQSDERVYEWHMQCPDFGTEIGILVLGESTPDQSGQSFTPVSVNVSTINQTLRPL